MFTRNGLTVPSNPKGYLMRIAAFDIWDTHCYDRYLPIREGMTVVDVGASIGFFSIYASSKVGPTGRVIAFEPEPVSYSYLVNNISSLPNVSAVNVGLSNENKIAKMFYQPSTGAQYSVLSQPFNDAKSIDATLRRLDSELTRLNISHVDFLKIDTEGAEYPVLEGLGEMLWGVDNIAMELHSTYFRGVESPEQLKQYLEGYGFRVKQTTHYGLLPHMYATRDPTAQFPLIETWQLFTIAGVAGLVAYQVMKK